MQHICVGEVIKAFIKSQDKYKQYKLGYIQRIGVDCIVYKAENIFDESDVICVQQVKEISKNNLELYKILEKKRLDYVVNILFVQEDKRNSYFIGMDEDDGTLTELCYKFSKEGRPKEIQISFFDQMIKQIAQGIYSIHSNQIIHRYLKPDNIVYKKNGDQYYFMLYNLISQEEIINVKKKIKKESPTYMAPELLQNDKQYHKSADIWAFGVMIYQLLSNQELFQGKSIEKVQYQILEYKQDNLDKNNPEYLKLPGKYQNLLKMMIVEEPKKRIKIKQVLEYLDRQDNYIQNQMYGHACQFSDWDYFKMKIQPDLRNKLLSLQTKLRPYFVNQRDLIYKILIKIGDDLNKQNQSQDEEKYEQKINGIKFRQSEIQIIMKHINEFFQSVKEQFISNQRLINKNE